MSRSPFKQNLYQYEIAGITELGCDVFILMKVIFHLCLEKLNERWFIEEFRDLLLLLVKKEDINNICLFSVQKRIGYIILMK